MIEIVRMEHEAPVIDYSYLPTPFGEMMMAYTSEGICCLEFCGARAEGVRLLRERFPDSSLHYKEGAPCVSFDELIRNRAGIRLHLKGSGFRLKVWEALLQIPAGETVTYGDIAAAIGQPKATRAVGSAIGANPVAVVIPCHRVIPASGEVGNYRWGSERKRELLTHERALSGGNP